MQKNAVANISKVNYYDAIRETRVKFTALGYIRTTNRRRVVGYDLVCIQVPKYTRKKLFNKRKNFNRSNDWWSDTPQDWRNEDREGSILVPKWNQSLSITN